MRVSSILHGVRLLLLIVQGIKAYNKIGGRESWGSDGSRPSTNIYGVWWVPLAFAEDDRRVSAPILGIVLVVAG